MLVPNTAGRAIGSTFERTEQDTTYVLKIVNVEGTTGLKRGTWLYRVALISHYTKAIV